MASTRSILKSHYKARQEVTWSLITTLALNSRLRSRTISGLAFSVPSEIQGLVAPAGYLRFDAQVFRGKIVLLIRLSPYLYADNSPGEDQLKSTDDNDWKKYARQ